MKEYTSVCVKIVWMDVRIIGAHSPSFHMQIYAGLSIQYLIYLCMALTDQA